MAFVSSDVYDCQAEEGPIEQVVPAPAKYTRSDPPVSPGVDPRQTFTPPMIPTNRQIPAATVMLPRRVRPLPARERLTPSDVFRGAAPRPH